MKLVSYLRNCDKISYLFVNNKYAKTVESEENPWQQHIPNSVK